MDQELREAEIAGDWQRYYALLRRVGRDAEAATLFLDHPITVDCTIQYQYRIWWDNPNAESSWGLTASLIGCDLNQVLEEFIAKKAGTSQIKSVYREPVYRILGKEIKNANGPLRPILFKEKSLQELKERIKAHPDYMKGATAEQLAAARQADELDAEKAIRKIHQEELLEVARQRRQAIQDNFENDSKVLREKGWDLWVEHNQLPRPEFARSIEKYPLRFILFRMRTWYAETHRAEATGKVAWAKFITYWHETQRKRLTIWKRLNKRQWETI